MAVLHTANWIRFPYPGDPPVPPQPFLKNPTTLPQLIPAFHTLLRQEKGRKPPVYPAKIHNRGDLHRGLVDRKTCLLSAQLHAGQFGRPTFSAAGVFTMFAGAISAMIESLGDYYAAARISGAPVPPPDVLARGVTWQGISCVLTGDHPLSHGQLTPSAL